VAVDQEDRNARRILRVEQQPLQRPREPRHDRELTGGAETLQVVRASPHRCGRLAGQAGGIHPSPRRSQLVDLDLQPALERLGRGSEGRLRPFERSRLEDARTARRRCGVVAHGLN
jgi:hypothetical protein